VRLWITALGAVHRRRVTSTGRLFDRLFYRPEAEHCFELILTRRETRPGVLIGVGWLAALRCDARMLSESTDI
jgi:hypothetical protein